MIYSRKWDIRFLELAQLIASWSKDPSTKVGAVIVDDTNVVRGMGYNGFPRGVHDSDDRYQDRELKYKFVVHAELNAVLNATSPVRGCKIYVWPTLMIPNICPECCKAVIQAGIYEVIGFEGETQERWQNLAAISGTMLREAQVNIRLVAP